MGGVFHGLDAIHLAAAQVMGDELEAPITHDERRASAARLTELPVDENASVQVLQNRTALNVRA